MIEPNTPVDIGSAEIAGYHEAVEELFDGFVYGGKKHSLADLMRHIDSSAKHVMGDVERDTYVHLRDGMQLFRALTAMLGDKVGLKKKLMATPTARLGDDPELKALRSFCHNYATYAAALTVSKKLDGLIRTLGFEDEADRPDLSMLELDPALPETSVVKRLLVPVYAQLIANESDHDVFRTPIEFPIYVKEVFDRYVELALAARDQMPELNEHLRGYRFRIFDEFVVLEGYEDLSVSKRVATASEAAATFQPIQPGEIVGNRSAKRKLVRYIERLALYDFEEQMNPILDLGGLSWSNLFDGLPGTGKSSLFRLAMTWLKQQAEGLDARYHIVTVDQSIKDEYYGKTGKILLEKLQSTHDPQALTLVIFDDIDLLTSSRGDAQGADNDVNNIIMQYMDGVFTVRRGNVINFAASNEPTGLDDALRNRFNDRLLVDGPTTGEDFADMLMLLGGKLIDRGLLGIEIGYDPFATQDQRRDDGGWTGEDVASHMAEELGRYKTATVLEFGNFMADLKAKNERITGRSMRAIVEAIKERSADFDIPQEWFATREPFLDQAYPKKIELLAELYAPITPDILFQEGKRYFESEERFAHTEAEGHVSRGYNSLKWNIQAELQFQEEQLERGELSDLTRLHALRDMNQRLAAAGAKVVEQAIARAAAGGAKK